MQVSNAAKITSFSHQPTDLHIDQLTHPHVPSPPPLCSRRRPLGMLSMPFNTTSIKGLYCVGDSTFPGQGVNAVVFSGFGCAHR